MGRDSYALSRREYLGVGAVSLCSLAGCVGGLAGSTGSEQQSFELTVTRNNGSLSGSVSPREARGVITISVGDTVALSLHNKTDVAIGLHNHVTDSEFVVPAGATQAREFTPEQSAVGRDTVEAYLTTESTHTDSHHHDEDENHHHDEDNNETGDTEQTASQKEEMSGELYNRSGTGGRSTGAVTVLTIDVRPKY